MDISSEILDTLDIVGSKNVMEVLKDGVAEEDIILETEMTEDTEETEIEEIIEIIEEIEECDETLPDNDASLSNNKEKTSSTKNGMVAKDGEADKSIEMYSFDEENSMFTSPSVTEASKSMNNSTPKSNSMKQVIKYDVDEDWQDEDLERMEEENTEIQTQAAAKSNKKHVNNQSVAMPLQSNRLDVRTHMDSMAKSDKSRMDSSIGGNVNNVEDNGDTHEIVKNVENNLLYTVLGSKKQDSSAKQQEKFNDAHYIKVGIQGVC